MIWTASSKFGTYRLCEQRRFRRARASAQSRQNLRCSRIRAVFLRTFAALAHTSSESRGTFRQKARSLAPLNGWACAVKICHDGMLEDTNLLDGAHMNIGYLPNFCITISISSVSFPYHELLKSYTVDTCRPPRGTFQFKILSFSPIWFCSINPNCVIAG